jgi:hypothetical protein
VIGVAALAGVIGAAVWFFILRDQGGTEAADAAETTGEPRSGTIDNPYPFGTPVMVFYGEADAQVEWVVQVLQPATEQAIGDGAEAPPEGEVFAITRISILFQRGPAPGPLSDLRLNAVGAPGTVFDQTANACPSVADPIDLTASLQPGQQVEGNVCWRIPASELADLKLAIEVGEVDGTVHISLA